VNAAGKTIRKTISVNAFPHPPRSGVCTNSLPPSPLSGGLVPRTPSSNLAERDLVDSPANLSNPKVRRSKKLSLGPGSAGYTGSSTPSLLNGSGDSKSISSGAGARGSDGLLSLPSPPQSRSSSAQGSYSTSATNYDDSAEGPRGRQNSNELGDDHTSSKHADGKGNVLVSVRIRPDAKGDNSKTSADWVVNSKKSLISYQGKEGGDYYYGKIYNINNSWNPG